VDHPEKKKALFQHWIKSEGIREFPRPNPKLWKTGKMMSNLWDHILPVDKCRDKGVVFNIILENTIGTIKRASTDGIDGVIVAAYDPHRTRTFLEKTPLLLRKKKGGFPPEKFFFERKGFDLFYEILFGSLNG
jgi:hypothetical protein